MFARPLRLPRYAVSLLLVSPLARGAGAGDEPPPSALLDRSLAAAEQSLQRRDFAATEGHYRVALFEGWLLLGTLEGLAGHKAPAREALQEAARAGAGDPAQLTALATAHLRIGDAAPAIELLGAVAAETPGDAQALRLLARALAASGQREAALQKLDAARERAATDPELTFHVATDYLRLQEPDVAARLFAEVVKARPIPQSQVLIGRAYRDASEYERATAALRAALAQDRSVRHAHYYLGMVLRADPRVGPEGRERAIAEFREELKVSPRDPATNDQLGLALIELERFEEALPALQLAMRGEPRSLYAYHLGRCLLGLNRPADAATLLKQALELAARSGDESELDKVHYQLGLALRKLGAADEAAAHFAEAKRLAAASDPGPEGAGADAIVPLIEASALAELPVAEKAELKRRVVTGLCRSYLNLGILQAQQERFEAAAELFARAAALDADFPQIQSSLGIAYFNARQFDKATQPLLRAVSANPNDAGLARMLALAWLNTQAYAKAVELLQDDPQREVDPSLQFAYGLALVKSDRAPEAEAVFAKLLARHGDSAELSVFLGQAHAQQGNFDAAIASLEHALALKADVAEANATLGIIYLKQGRLPEAEAAFKAELALHPEDALSRHNLARSLELQGRASEALPLLRSLLQAQPDFADARYLLGKILLAQGQPEQAIEQLEAGVRLAPDDANIHYQLAQAYQKTGQQGLAEQHFEAFRSLKEKKRGSTP